MPFEPLEDAGLPSVYPALPIETKGHYNLSDVGWAALRQANTAGSLLKQEPGLPSYGQPVNPDFDPFALIPEEKKQYALRYAFANSAAEVDAINRQIDREDEDRATLAGAGGFGVLAQIGAGVVDPVNLIPGVGVLDNTYRTGGSVLRGAMIHAGVGMGTMTASEAVLQQSQVTRTFGESALNIAGGAFIGGVLGGTAGAFARAVNNYSSKTLDELVRATEAGLNVPKVGRYTKLDAETALSEYDLANKHLVDIKAAGVTPEHPDFINAALAESQAKSRWEEVVGSVHEEDFLDDGVPIPEDALFRDTTEGGNYTASSIGDALARQTGDESLKGEGWISKLPIVNQQDPLIRTMLSKSIATRTAVQRLAETPLKYAKNALGVATQLPVEMIVKQSKAPLAFALRNMDEQFIEYRLGRAGKMGDKARLLTEDVMPGDKTHLTYQMFKEEVGKAMQQGDVHPVPQVQKAARRFRKDVFDPFKDKAVKLGLLPEGVMPENAVSYLTRVWNIEKINQQYDEFFNINLEWLRKKELERPAAMRRNDAELRDVVEQLIERIKGGPAGRLRYNLLGDEPDRADMFKVQKRPGNKGKPTELQTRVYDIPDNWVSNFLDTDIEYVAKAYERSLAPDLALIEVFGDTTLEKEVRAIRKEYTDKMRAAKTPREKRLLDELRKRDERDLMAMVERIRGTYGLPADPSNTWSRAGRVLRTFNYLTTMGGIMISSVPDLARTVMVHGLSRTMKDGLVPLMRDFKTLWGNVGLSARETQLSGTALDMVLDSRVMALSDVFDEYGHGTMGERMLSGLQSGFGKVSGISQWNSGMKQFAGLVTQSRIIDAVLDSGTGKIKPKELEALAASYIDKNMARRIAGQFEKYGDTQDGVRLLNTERWTDIEAVRRVRAAIVRDVDRIIVTPGQDKPLWMSSELGKIIGQFKSFFMSATQRVMLSGLQDFDLGVMNGLTLAVGLGVGVTMIKYAQAGRPLPENPEQLLLEGVDRAGVTGWLFEANNMAEKMTRGRFGFSALMGKEPMSRYASRNVTDALVGPSIGRVEDAARITGAVSSGEWDQTDTRAIRRLIPFQNLFYIRGLFDRAHNGINAQLGVEPEFYQD